MSFSLQNFSGLLFDFDGTLANTEDLHNLAMRKFFREKEDIQKAKGEAGKSTLTIFREWGAEIEDLEKAEVSLKEYCEFLPQYFAENLEQVHWYEDAKKLLEATKYSTRALVTGTFRVWLEPLDPKLKIFEKFTTFVTKEDVLPDREKPDPLAYQLGAKRLGFKPGECIAVEDSYAGVSSAKQAGCFVVAVKRDSTKGFEQADMVVESLEEIIP